MDRVTLEGGTGGHAPTDPCDGEHAYRRSGVGHPGFLESGFSCVQIQTLDLQQLALLLQRRRETASW